MSARKRWHAVAGGGAAVVAGTTVASFIAAELAARLVYGSQARRRKARGAVDGDPRSPGPPPKAAQAAM
jgi:hypothetical protein